MEPTQQERVGSLQVRTTRDGSPTLYVPALDEHYHSVHGALQESRYVFLQRGLQHVLEQKPAKVHVLEVGLGTGLNAALTLEATLQHDIQLRYHAVEAYPLPEEMVQGMAIEALLGASPAAPYVAALHHSLWNKEQELAPGFNFLKRNEKLQDASLPAGFYQLVYFDAFAPEKQPELWTLQIFEKLYSSMQPGGVLVTYCAKGIVKRTLLNAGFTVEKLPGPPGKREMTRATRPH